MRFIIFLFAHTIAIDVKRKDKQSYQELSEACDILSKKVGGSKASSYCKVDLITLHAFCTDIYSVIDVNGIIGFQYKNASVPQFVHEPVSCEDVFEQSKMIYVYMHIKSLDVPVVTSEEKSTEQTKIPVDFPEETLVTTHNTSDITEPLRSSEGIQSDVAVIDAPIQDSATVQVSEEKSERVPRRKFSRSKSLLSIVGLVGLAALSRGLFHVPAKWVADPNHGPYTPESYEIPILDKLLSGTVSEEALLQDNKFEYLLKELRVEREKREEKKRLDENKRLEREQQIKDIKDKIERERIERIERERIERERIEREQDKIRRERIEEKRVEERIRIVKKLQEENEQQIKDIKDKIERIERERIEREQRIELERMGKQLSKSIHMQVEADAIENSHIPVSQRIMIWSLLEKSPGDTLWKNVARALGVDELKTKKTTMYRMASQLVHPDKCKHLRAEEAMVKLSLLHEVHKVRKDI